MLTVIGEQYNIIFILSRLFIQTVNELNTPKFKVYQAVFARYRLSFDAECE